MKLRLLRGMCWMCFLVPGISFGQGPTLIGDFQDQPFPQLVEFLESEHGMRVFYLPEWVDELKVSHSRLNPTLEQLLDSTFAGTEIQYFFRDEQTLFLSLDQGIIPFNGNRYWRDSSQRTSDISLDFLQEQPQVSISSAINTSQRFTFGDPNLTIGASNLSIGGYVRDAQTGEALVGASVFVENPSIGTLSDAFGYYVLTLPRGTHDLRYQYVGKKVALRIVELHGPGNLDVELEEEILSLNEVVISGEKSQVESVQTGSVRLNMDEIKTIPTVLGESDILKISLTLPGVQSVGEGSAGFHVRGGTTDQNLILLDDIPLYNPNHLFGFFSAFNPAMVKYAQLSKSGIQAQYGGRASSVFDIAIRDGNRKKLVAAGGISPLTGKVSLEGPLHQEKGSFILGLRSTYANWLLKALNDPELSNSRAYFGDALARVQFALTEKDNISLSAYHSQDRFRLDADTLFQYANTLASLRWRHVFNNKFSSLFNLGYTRYTYDIGSEASPSNAFDLSYGIDQYTAKIGFDFYPNSRHHVQFGVQGFVYQLNPGSILPVGDSSGIRPEILDTERGLESAIYLGDEFTISNRLSIYGGIRFSTFSLLGPGESFLYAPDLPKETQFIIDTLAYSNGERIQSYSGPEYRFSSRYKLDSHLSVKLSYDKSRQYIHRLTNTIAVSPTDTWRLSNPHLGPQISDQLALGFYQEIDALGLELSLESYYKRLRNILEYKDGADLLVNETLEADVLSAKGRAYGLEFLFKKKTGQLNGWISYTWSRTLLKANGAFREETINRGDWYPANYDKPHNLSLVSNYKVNRRVNFSLNMAYSTGRPTTVPISQYQFRGTQLAFFSERNQYRIPDYFRVDFAMNIEGNHKVEKVGHSSWSLSIYNLTGRNNAYSIFSRFQDGSIQTFQLSVFAQPVLTLTYNFELR